MRLQFSSRFAILLLSCLFVSSATAKLSNYLKDFHTTSDPDTYLDVPQIIKRHGYPIETHVVRTEDGYLLELHRIPRGINDTSNAPGAKRKPILLHHGILSCSVDWIINGPHKSLGYKLADLGYDVWIANARGNTYSRAHVSRNPKDEDFWQFSFHEIGTYDIPAIIDHILATNGADQVRYIGHSMGTTVFYVMCSTRPEYRSKVKLHIGLAPVAFLANTRSAVRYFAPYMERFARMSNWYNKGAFLERDLMTRMTINLLCTREMFNMNICERYIIFLLFGKDKPQFDDSLIPTIVSHLPAGTSAKTLLHFSQFIKSGSFQYFDYGLKGNIVNYNASTPPMYNISDVTVPAALFYGQNDLMADPTDVQLLYKRLANPIGLHKVGLEEFNHVDFIWSLDCESLLNIHIISILEKCEKPNGLEKMVEAGIRDRNKRIDQFPSDDSLKTNNYGDYGVRGLPSAQVEQILQQMQLAWTDYGKNVHDGWEHAEEAFKAQMSTVFNGFNATAYQVNLDCRTTRDEDGTCVNIRNCPETLKSLLIGGERKSISEMLRRSQCGWEGEDAKVCCPLTGVLACGRLAVNSTADRIVGGQPATLGSWPWIVALGYTSARKKSPSFLCGGTLISNRHVVTAAHCVRGLPTTYKLRLARLGDLDLNDKKHDGATPVDIEVEKAVSHPEFAYQRSTLRNDIAVLTLARPAPITRFIRPICLPSISTLRNSDYKYRLPMVAGWGKLKAEGGEPANTVLYEGPVPIVDEATCKSRYRNFSEIQIDGTVLCAGLGDRDSCQGDSGGPLVVSEGGAHYLIGVVSFGIGCADSRYPGVYARVARYIDWITDNLV